MDDARIGGLEKRVDRMETSIQTLCEKVGVSDAILVRLEATQSKLVDALEHFGAINEEIKLTLRDMQHALNNNADVTTQLSGKISSIEKKFDESEEKSKIDWRIAVKDVLKKSLPWFLAILVSLIYILKDLLVK
jgi:chromosome segregation ATPase